MSELATKYQNLHQNETNLGFFEWDKTWRVKLYWKVTFYWVISPIFVQFGANLTRFGPTTDTHGPPPVYWRANCPSLASPVSCEYKWGNPPLGSGSTNKPDTPSLSDPVDHWTLDTGFGQTPDYVHVEIYVKVGLDWNVNFTWVWRFFHITT